MARATYKVTSQCRDLQIRGATTEEHTNDLGVCIRVNKHPNRLAGSLAKDRVHDLAIQLSCTERDQFPATLL